MLDVYRGLVAPSTVIRRIHSLGRYQAGSALGASVLKNPDLVGWDRHMSMGADVWDAIVATAQRKKGSKAPKYPRPSTRKRNSTGIPLASLAPHRRARKG